jgi:hypothetical protein
MTTKKFYRPIGLRELELILNSDSKGYPPRLDWQPIFYPVLNFQYAAQIAGEWNAPDKFSGYVGFVTEFDIDADYVSKFNVENVGSFEHNELWVPSEELVEFNNHIVGHIQVSKAFYGSKYLGKIENTLSFEEANADAQFEKISQLIDNQLVKTMDSERNAVYINFAYWLNKGYDKSILDKIKDAWSEIYPNLNLNTEGVV